MAMPTVGLAWTTEGVDGTMGMVEVDIDVGLAMVVEVDTVAEGTAEEEAVAMAGAEEGVVEAMGRGGEWMKKRMDRFA
jgi:hypothetical protein